MSEEKQSWIRTYFKEITIAVIVAVIGVAVPIFIQSDKDEEYHLRAVIDDPDGYTYVRSLPNLNGQIVTTVKEGEIYHTHVQTGNWWHIKTKDNQYGYMHVTRIRLIDDD